MRKTEIITKCIKYKCKTCPKFVECEKEQKETRLMYRPFENLAELLKQKRGDD